MKKIFLALTLLFTLLLIGCSTTTTEDPLVVAYNEGYAAGYEEGYEEASNIVSWTAEWSVYNYLNSRTVQVFFEKDINKMIDLVDDFELTYKQKQDLKEYLSNMNEEEANQLYFTIKLWLEYNNIYE